MTRKRLIYFRSPLGLMSFQIARPLRKRTKAEAADTEDRPPPKPTHHAPCSVEKVEELARRLEAGEELWNKDDFVPTDPIMIRRYVFSGRKAAKLGTLAARFIVPELLASSPRARHE